VPPSGHARMLVAEAGPRGGDRRGGLWGRGRRARRRGQSGHDAHTHLSGRRHGRQPPVFARRDAPRPHPRQGQRDHRGGDGHRRRERVRAGRRCQLPDGDDLERGRQPGDLRRRRRHSRGRRRRRRRRGVRPRRLRRGRARSLPRWQVAGLRAERQQPARRRSLPFAAPDGGSGVPRHVAPVLTRRQDHRLLALRHDPAHGRGDAGHDGRRLRGRRDRVRRRRLVQRRQAPRRRHQPRPRDHHPWSAGHARGSLRRGPLRLAERRSLPR
jgi:hypothetical protein